MRRETIHAYLLLFPRANVLTLIVFGFYVRLVRIPAVLVLGFDDNSLIVEASLEILIGKDRPTRLELHRGARLGLVG